MLKKVTEQKLDNNSFNIFDNYNKDYIFDFTNYNKQSIKVCKEKSNEAMRFYLLALAA